MRKALLALGLTAVSLVPSVSHAQHVVVRPAPPPAVVVRAEPPSGLSLIITGGVFTGIGAINLFTAPVCKTSAIGESAQNACLGASLGLGIAFIAIGIPLIVVGANRRTVYVEWHRRGGVAQSLTDLGFDPKPGGGALTWHANF